MFQRFLIAIDDSPGSEIAVDFATAVARRCSASAHVFFANEYVVGGRGVTLLSSKEATALIAGAVEQLREAGITASGSSCAATYRDVAKHIAETAREQSADAIILGSHRRRSFARLFSSRVRERTIRLSELPVLAAPSPLTTSSRHQNAAIDFGFANDDLTQILEGSRQLG